MGHCFSTSSRRRIPPPPPQLMPAPGWSDLPADLAGLIFSSLPSHHDRLSFRAVCSQWRLGALRQHPLPPALPWLLTLRHPHVYQSIADGVVRAIPEANSALCCHSSYDGWLLDMYMGDGVCVSCDDHYCRYVLKNPFSDATIDIPCSFDQPINTFIEADRHSTWLATFTLRKIIVCSPELVVAAVYSKNIVSFRPGIDRLWSVLSSDDDDDQQRRIYEDIALYRGKLYAVTSKKDLLVHETRDNSTLSRAEHAIRAESPLTHLEEQYNLNYFVRQYLVISCSGKLLMVRCTTNYPHVGGIANVNNAIQFKVFEADLEGGQWLEVNNLDGQIIFLSKACSKAIPCSSDNGDLRFGGNCIFFLGDDLTIWGDLAMYGVYDLTTSTTSLISIGQEFKRPIYLRWFITYSLRF